MNPEFVPDGVLVFGELARPNEGSAKKPPKGKFVEGVLFMSRLPFAEALRVKSRDPQSR
jgi:hypothetical protein